jgi:2'-5' RNA ligase superfamily
MSALLHPRRWLGNARRLVLGAPTPRQTAAVVLPLGVESSNWITRAQYDLLRRQGGNPALEASPHVSLKLGFQPPDLEPLAGWLERLARETPPVSLALRGVACFEEGILYLEVVPNAALDRLRRRIVAELASEFGVVPGPLDGDAFIFHATVGYGVPRPVIDAELARLRTLPAAFDELSGVIELWFHTGTHWVPYHRALLSGPPDSSVSPATAPGAST